MATKKTAAKKAAKPQTIKAKFWIYMSNQGDGSAVAKFFSSEVAAEKYASHDDERFCEDIYSKTLEFDLDGNLVGPDPIHWSEE